MNNLQVFKNNTFGNLRVVQKDNQTWFVAKDVTDILGYQNGSRDALHRLDEDERGSVLVDTLTTKVTGKGQQYFINKFLGS